MCVSKLGPTSSSKEPQTSPQLSARGGREGEEAKGRGAAAWLALCSRNTHDQNVLAREGARLGAPGVGGELRGRSGGPTTPRPGRGTNY